VGETKPAVAVGNPKPGCWSNRGCVNCDNDPAGPWCQVTRPGCKETREAANTGLDALKEPYRDEYDQNRYVPGTYFRCTPTSPPPPTQGLPACSFGGNEADGISEWPVSDLKKQLFSVDNNVDQFTPVGIMAKTASFRYESKDCDDGPGNYFGGRAGKHCWWTLDHYDRVTDKNSNYDVPGLDFWPQKPPEWDGASIPTNDPTGNWNAASQAWYETLTAKHEGFESDSFDFYELKDDGHVMLKAGHACSSSDESLSTCADKPLEWSDTNGDKCSDYEWGGWCAEHGAWEKSYAGVTANDACCTCGGGTTVLPSSVEECAALCRAKSGCKYFLFGTGDKAGKCYWEKTANGCTGGHYLEAGLVGSPQSFLDDDDDVQGEYKACAYHGEVTYEKVVGSIHHFIQMYEVPVFAKYCCSNACRARSRLSNFGSTSSYPDNFGYGSNGFENIPSHQKYTFIDGKCEQNSIANCYTYGLGDKCANPAGCLYGSDCTDCGRFAVCNEDPNNPGQYSGEKRIMDYIFSKRHWFVETDATKDNALKEQSPGWDATPEKCSRCTGEDFFMFGQRRQLNQYGAGESVMALPQ
jgi:hypothetical protein